MPLIALTFIALRHSAPTTLWCAAFLGGLIDLLSDDPMGVHALNYVIAAALLYRLRCHFLWDSPLHFSLFSALFAAVSTILELLLLFLFDRRLPFDGKWILTDLVGMSIAAAFIAFVGFSLPLWIFKIVRRFWVLFWLKKKSRSLT